MAEPRDPLDHESDGEQSGGYRDRPAIAGADPSYSVGAERSCFQPKASADARRVGRRTVKRPGEHHRPKSGIAE
jgi:hypothetical protein